MYVLCFVSCRVSFVYFWAECEGLVQIWELCDVWWCESLSGVVL